MNDMKNNKFESNKKYFTICIYALFVILLGTLIIKAIIDWDHLKDSIHQFINILSPFLIGAFIAYLINPFVKRLDFLLQKIFHEKLPKVRKFLSIFISYLIVGGIIVIVMFRILPQIVKSLTDLISLIPGLYTELLNFLDTFEENYPDFDFQFINQLLESAGPDLINYLKDLATNMLPLIYTTSVSVIRWILNILIAIIASTYMLSDKKILGRNFKRLVYAIVKKARADEFINTLRECDHIFGGFIIGKTIDSTIIGALCFVFMTLLKIPYTLLISVIVGVTNMIPYFGPFIGAIPGIFILLLIDPVKALIFAILILALQQFDGLILGPKILGDSTGLKPLWIIFAITIGGYLAGPFGMFFGVPITAVISFLSKRWIDKRLKAKEIDIPEEE